MSWLSSYPPECSPLQVKVMQSGCADPHPNMRRNTIRFGVSCFIQSKGSLRVLLQVKHLTVMHSKNPLSDKGMKLMHGIAEKNSKMIQKFQVLQVTSMKCVVSQYTVLHL